MEPTYFTATLDQAADHQQGKSYSTIVEFIDFKARTAAAVPVLGLYEITQKPAQPWRSEILTFKDVQRGIALVAGALSNTFDIEQGQTVALLCPSSAGLLFTWLGLVWLGHPVLLVAPQCPPSAVAQLCKSCRVELMLYEAPYADLAAMALEEASKNLGDSSLTTHPLPFAGEDILRVIKNTTARSFASPADVQETDVAYLHHTSGTSSGAPKPVPQTHRAAIGVLPILDGTRHATFTTTPLYHGGVADLLRAWTSNALVWVFPGKDLPITAANICKCLDLAATLAGSGMDMAPEIRYFSSVPYVLQMVADDKDGRKHLQSMDIVGVGGADLPAEVGDGLVEDNVNLISRFGSAECGFLMSSHRDYSTDKEWQYLRTPSGGEFLRFESRDDGLSELVIQPGWPHMAKRNRQDGSYATADLFTPHPTVLDAWRYHSRGDSQLTLITGKKFDPAPLEDAIRAAASSLIQDILIFGNGRPYPGALLFPLDVAQLSDEDLVRRIAPVVEALNRKGQSYARIPMHMLIPMDPLDRGLERSSKGTVLRNRAEERFAEKIAAAYEDVLPESSGSAPELADSEIPARVCSIVQGVVGEGHNHLENSLEALTEHTDLFAYGVDSVACMQIRHALSRLLPRGSALPLTMVQDAGTVAGLSELVIRIRSGKSGPVPSGRGRDAHDLEHQLMLDMVDEYSVFDEPQSHQPSSPASSSMRVETHGSPPRRPGVYTNIQVLLTGSTGSLGAHILHQLLYNPRVSKIHLLVRGATRIASRERVLKALDSRCLPVPAFFDAKTQIHNCNISDAKLGLSDEAYEQLAEGTDVIVHLAWSVNFLLPLRAFAKTHLAGTRNLIKLAARTSSKGKAAPRFIFCSSVAAVSNHSLSTTSPSNIPERVLPDPAVAGPTGYGRSKWVAEQICQRAAEQIDQLRNRVSIARVGQLSGASNTGVWSCSEAYPLMLSSLKVTGCLPDLDRARRDKGKKEGEILAWLPVDVAARAFVEDIVDRNDDPEPFQQQNNDQGVTVDAEIDGTRAEDGAAVHHVLNPCTRITWSDFLSWLCQEQAFETVTADEWLSRLSSLQDSIDGEKRNHPALRLLGFWDKAYGASERVSNAAKAEDKEADATSSRSCPDRRSGTGSEREQPRSPAQSRDIRLSAAARYEMTKTYKRMPLLKDSEGLVNEEYASKLWRWIKDNI